MHGDKRWPKYCQTGFEDFADGTSFHGFHEIYYSKTWFWRITWSIVVAAAMGITGYQVYRSVFEYIEQGSITIITPVEPGGLAYPPLSVCFIHWITWVDWKKAFALGLTKETLLYAFSYISPIFSPTVFDVDKAGSDLKKVMAMHDISTLSELYVAIAKSFPMVLALLGGGFLMEEPLFFKNITFRTTNSEIYLCYSLTGQEILDILESRQSGNAIKSSTRSNFNFSIQDTTFAKYSEHISPDEYNYYIADWLLHKTNYWMTTLSDYKKNYTGFMFPVRVYPDANADKYVEISKENDAYSVEMQPTVHRKMNQVSKLPLQNKKKDTCIVGMKSIASYHKCQDECTATLQKQMKMCRLLDMAMLSGDDTLENMCPFEIQFLPVIFGQIPAPKPYEYTAFSEGKISSDDRDLYHSDYDDCVALCTPTCEIWKYEYTSMVTTLAAEARVLSFKNQTDITIVYPEESDVLIMIDADSRTWEDFVANVGGLLGVWTGASIISFLEMVYLCCFKENTCECFDHNLINPIKGFKMAFVKPPPMISSTIEVTPRGTNLQMVEIWPPKLPPV